MASFAPIRGTRAQIQATPIVDGQFLVETDQGVDNKIYMDEGSTRTIVGGNTVTGVLPELYIYSETGSVVTVEDAGGTSIPTSQIGTDHWICEVPDYGVYTVYSVLSGDTTTQSVNVTDCMIYTIDDSHFHCNVVVTYPSGVGASCQISGGGETYSAPALNPPDTSYKFVVHGKNTTYTITTNVDGAIKTQTVTTGTVLDQTYNVTMPYARVNLTVEMPPITGNVICTDGTTTITKTATPNMVFYLPNTGSWTFTGSDGVDTYDTIVTVDDLSIVYNEDLSSAPDGATVLPTDDIQIWLQCAKIKDKTTYTTLNDVLNDNETLQKLISSDNAMNYLVRSKTWMASNNLVPAMTSNNTPSGQVIYSAQDSSHDAYMAFNGVPPVPSGAISTNYWSITGGGTGYIGYVFDTPQICREIKYFLSTTTATRTVTITNVEGSVDGTTNFVPITFSGDIVGVNGSYQTLTLDNNTAYKAYKISMQSSDNMIVVQTIELYSIRNGITDDSTAMRLIGEKNYAANTLLDDSDWREGICDSEYFESVLNIKIPIMTSDTTPSGVASASREIQPAYCAFNDDFTNWWSDNTVTTWVEPCWLQYQFPNAVKIYKFGLGALSSNRPWYPKEFYIQGSNDNFTTEDDLYHKVYTSAPATGSKEYDVLSTIGTYDTYRFRFISSFQGNMGVGFAQFYGREDVDETVYHVYSAADDTITATPQGGGAAITITTNNNGYGTIAKSSLPDGTYAFTSSKANDPDNLNNNYSDTIAINSNNTIEIALMPQNVIYWWGYLSKICEDATTANGWTLSGYTFNAPTHNLNNVTCTGASGVIQGLATKIKINCKNGLNQISIVDAKSANNNVYGDLYGVDTKTILTTQCRITTAGVQKVVNSNLQGEKYLLAEADNNGRIIDIYALLYEYV